MRELLLRFVYDPEVVTDDLVSQRYEASLAALAEEVFLQLLPLDRRKVGTPTPGLPEELISAIRHRVLILHGREDSIIPATNSVRLNELIESSDLRIFGKCGHWVQIEQERKFQQAVVEFLDAK
ncbi:MAG: alpha/beta fold hydrolase [Gammaproteobacteria bacterium]|nr:alpha/beta fold hydrolase [Gammaproteobacteria bacterium]